MRSPAGRRRCGPRGSRRGRGPRSAPPTGRPTPGQPAPRPSGAIDSTSTRSSGVSRSTVSGAVDLDVRRAGGLGRGSRWARRLPGPNAKSMTSGGRRPSALVPVAVAVGDEDDARRRRRRRRPRRAHEDARSPRDVTNGRSIGRTRIASAPPATTSSRASAQPGVEAARPLAERPRTEIGRAAQDLAIGADRPARRRAGRRPAAASTVRASNPSTRSWRSSASSALAEPASWRPRASRPG